MSLFRKLFGAGDPLTSIRRAVAQKRWADALLAGSEVDPAAQPETVRGELEGLLATAGDSLARINLDEGDACLRSGDPERAMEHFSLALGQARSPELKALAEGRLHRGPDTDIGKVPEGAVQACCPSGCGTGTGAAVDLADEDLDVQSRLDLILGTYPAEMAERCRQAGEIFRQAFLLAHGGRETEALERFEQVPPGQRDELYFFERGCLQARLGKGEQAIADLEAAAAGSLPLALESLVRLEIAMGRDRSAEERLRQMLEQGSDPGFCHGRLAAVFAGRGELGQALDHAEQAIRHGQDPESLQLAAALLEKEGRWEEAEACLARLASPGCGSHNLPLAEFWLRRRRNLDRALEAFKGALRHEPANPRWTMRIAQVYLERGWTREAAPLLKKALASPDIDPSLRREGMELLQKYAI